MVQTLEIGTARAQPGKLVYGALDAVELPSGGVDQFPVIIAQGAEQGPVLWLTASIHGAEYTGIAVIHRLLTPELVSELHGTIIAIPTLNPAGLRTGQRSPYYLFGQDPNRLFPVLPSRQSAALNADSAPVSPLELAYRRLFDLIANTADYLIDLHNYSIGALPFALRDPVYYRDNRERAAAQRLQETIGKMLDAFGHTIINEFVSSEFLKKNLHRSVSGAVLNTARIPAFTLELGGYMTVDPVIVDAASAGLRNLMRWAGMLSDAPEPINGIRVLSPGYPVRRLTHPYAPAAGVIQYLVQPGDTVTMGDHVARLTDIYGRPLGKNDGRIQTEYDGYVLGLNIGAACYQNDALLSLAVRDDGELLLPYPA